MQIDIAELFPSLKKELNEFLPDTIGLNYYEKAISIIKLYIEKMKLAISKINSLDSDTLIQLFKYEVPPILAEYIYYASLYNIESARPIGSKLKTYYSIEYDRIESWFAQHESFLRYYRNKQSHLDLEYFVHGSVGQELYFDPYIPLGEEQLCSRYSFIAAMGIAYQRLQKELTLRILAASPSPISQIHWTNSKTDLIELIYALYTAGVFNKGKTTIKEITSFFEGVLQISLGNTSVTFQEILRRKDSTVFLSRLLDCFDNYIDQIEQKNIR